MRKKSSSSSVDNERGVAMLEFALIAPFMVLLVIATWDLGNALNQYLTLTRVVYEGARYAATLPGLEKDIVVTMVDANAPNHNKVRDRVVDLLQRAGFDTNTLSVQTENTSNMWVKVTVNKPYRSIFGVFDNLNLRVSASGPFLSLAPAET